MEAFTNLETYLRGFLNVTTLQQRLQELQSWLLETVFVLSTLGQVATVVGAFVVARLTAPRLRGWIEARAERRQVEPRLRRIVLGVGLIAILWQWIAAAVKPRGDFVNFIETGRRFRMGEFLYANGLNTPYPPFWGLFHAPFSLVPVNVAIILSSLGTKPGVVPR